MMAQSTASPWMLRVTLPARASSARMESALRPKRPSSAASKAGRVHQPCSPQEKVGTLKVLFERKGLDKFMKISV